MSNSAVDDVGTRDPILATDYHVFDEQIVSLNEHGWCPVPGLLNREVVEGLRVAIREMNTSMKNSGYEGLTVTYSGGWERPFMRQVATSRRLSGVITQLTGLPTALFAQDVSFFKEPGCKTLALHQDQAHFPFDRRGCLSLWIALVDMTDDMGSLHYLDGSHKEGPLGFAQIPSRGDPEIRHVYPELNDREIVAGTAISAGDARAHWDLTVHGSGPNEGTDAREAWAVRYIREDTIYNGVSHSHFDQFDMKQGDKFYDHEAFPLVNAHGVIDKSS